VSRPLVGAYVCPRGSFCVEVRPRGAGLEVVRAFEQTGRIASASDAARHLAGTLAANGLRRADVAVVVRGFEVVHHTLTLPPAPAAMLGPIIEREIRRLEPQLTDAVVGWLPLLDRDEPADQGQQRHFIAAALPATVAPALENGLRDSGFALHHLTALPAAFQRLGEDHDVTVGTTALLAPLPDGLFLGLFLGGGLRISIEPPLLDQEMPDGAAMAEETELATTYVRQQYRGAELDRCVIAGPADQWTDTQQLLVDRLSLPVERLDLQGLSAASLAALGAVRDARSPAPLALGGAVLDRKANAARATLRQTAAAAVVATAAIGVWALFQSMNARRTDAELRATLRQLEQHSTSVAPLRQTAEQRRLVRDAGDVVRISIRDRQELQAALTAIGGGIVGPIRLDSLSLHRGSNGWIAGLSGTAAGTTSGGAVQALHDFYRDLPRRLIVEELALDQMSYRDTTDVSVVSVGFQLSFILPERKAP
jgi:hypothetical protein